MKILGIIPARGGSKGVPGKNILKFEEKPLIAYSIEVGQQCDQLSELIVNTDDDGIAEAAADYGCRVIKRSKELGSDTSSVVDVALETIRRFEEDNIFFDAIVLLQPTSPLRTAEDINKAISILEHSPETDAVLSMVSVGDHHPARMYRLDGSALKCEMPEYETTRRQELPPRYIRNGCIYLVRTEALRREKSFMPPNKSAYIMDSRWALNIDSEMDVILGQALIEKWNREKR